MFSTFKSSTSFKNLYVIAFLILFLGSVAGRPSSPSSHTSGFTKEMKRSSHQFSGNKPLNFGNNNTITTTPLRLQKRAVALLPLGLANFAAFTLLAESRLTSIAASSVSGDVGISPAAASYITGGFNPLAIVAGDVYATSPEVSGFVYAASYAAGAAKVGAAIVSARAAYTAAVNVPDPIAINIGGANLGGMNLSPGVYKFDTAVNINGILTLTGSCTDVFIFQISAVLSTEAGSSVALAGGLMAGTVFWQVAGGMQTGAASSFVGIILSQTTVVLAGTFIGQAYAGTSIDLEMVTITTPGQCPLPSSISSIVSVATSALPIATPTLAITSQPAASIPAAIATESPAATLATPTPSPAATATSVNEDANTLGKAAANLAKPSPESGDGDGTADAEPSSNPESSDPGTNSDPISDTETTSVLATYASSESATSQSTSAALPESTTTSSMPTTTPEPTTFTTMIMSTATVAPAQQPSQSSVLGSGASKTSSISCFLIGVIVLSIWLE